MAAFQLRRIAAGLRCSLLGYEFLCQICPHKAVWQMPNVDQIINHEMLPSTAQRRSAVRPGHVARRCPRSPQIGRCLKQRLKLTIPSPTAPALPPTGALASRRRLYRSRIRSRPVGNDQPQSNIAFHRVLRKLLRCPAIPPSQDKNLIKMPTPVRVLRLSTHHFLTQPANIGPNPFHQKRTVSRQMSMEHSNRTSWIWRNYNGTRIYIIPTSRMTLGELLK